MRGIFSQSVFWCTRACAGVALACVALACVAALVATPAWAADPDLLNIHAPWDFRGLAGLLFFVIAYGLVMAEEFTHLRKSKPVILAAGLIWTMLALAAAARGHPSEAVLAAFQHTFWEFSTLFLFLLVAMTFVNAMTERNVFNYLRYYLLHHGFSLRQIFWITGILSFFISPIADNLTTALLMCAVVLAIGKGNPRFISLACINIVVAANAGGAFSPFGDITTLMVWQAGILSVFQFLTLFVPSVVNYIVPAAIMHFALPDAKPARVRGESPDEWQLKEGAFIIIGLFLATISFTVMLHNVLHLPPVIGMMTGFSWLGFYGYYLKRRGTRPRSGGVVGEMGTFDIFNKVARAEWDTLLFFYGVILCVGGLGVFGYLEIVARFSYDEWGPFAANSAVGVLSAIVDNIPVMFAVITIFPEMDQGQWLLVTLTAGCGGSMLSIGSAAGVALMGQARGAYTFFGHLRWTWAIALGYVLSIATLYLLYSDLFDNIPLARH